VPIAPWGPRRQDPRSGWLNSMLSDCPFFLFSRRRNTQFACCELIAKFHYTGPTGPDRTRTDFFAAKLRWVRAGPVASGRARVVEFSY